MEAPIGVIDSGVGGLTVAKEIMRLLPNETIYYIGDTARCPYGPRPRHEVRNFTWQMAKALEKKGIGARVVSMPSVELFEKQSQEYKEEVLPKKINKTL